MPPSTDALVHPMPVATLMPHAATGDRMVPPSESSESLQSQVSAQGGTAAVIVGTTSLYCASSSPRSIRHSTFHTQGSRPVVPVRARTPPVVQLPPEAERFAARAASQGHAPRCSPMGTGRTTWGRTPWSLLEQARSMGRKTHPSPAGRRHGFEAVVTGRQQPVTSAVPAPVRGGVPASGMDEMTWPNATLPQTGKDNFLDMCSHAMVSPRQRVPVKLTPAMERILRYDIGERGKGQRSRTPKVAGDHPASFNSMARCRDGFQLDTVARRLPGSPMFDREAMADFTPRTHYLARGEEPHVLAAVSAPQREVRGLVSGVFPDPAKGNLEGTRPLAHGGQTLPKSPGGSTESPELLERWAQPSGPGSSAATRSQSAPPSLLGRLCPMTCTFGPAPARRCRSTVPTEFRMPARLSAAMERLANRKAGKDHGGGLSPRPEQPKAPSPMRRLVDMRKIQDIFAWYPLRSRSQNRNGCGAGLSNHVVTKCDVSSGDIGRDDAVHSGKAVDACGGDASGPHPFPTATVATVSGQVWAQ